MVQERQHQGRHNLVSGGASGIGAACARALADQGDRVSIFDVDCDAGYLIVDELSRNGHQIGLIVGDTTVEHDVDGAFETAEAARGPLTGVVIAAGISQHTDIEDLDVADWDRILNVNLRGAFFVIRAAIRRLRVNGGGSIVAVGSIDGMVAEPGAGPYCASKAGLHNLVRVAALEVARHSIRVNAVGPSATNTRMLQRHLTLGGPDHTAASLTARHPIHRLIEPAEVATVVRFLLSADASAITGTIIPVDLGLTAGWPMPIQESTEETS